MSADTILLNAGPEGGGGLPSNPFVGLRPFDVDEGILFYGRDRQIVELLKRLHGTRFLAVVGSSGCGKSSLIRAGLIPKLKAGFIVGRNDRWHVATMKPGDSPLRNMAAQMLKVTGARADGDAETSFAKEMRVSGSEAVLARAAPALESDGANLLLVVDQFEELFRYGDRAAGDAPEADDPGEAADEEAAAAGRERLREKAVKRLRHRDEASRFVSLMLDLARQREAPVYVVMTMRSDFLGDCDAYPRLPEEINKSIFLVPRLDREQRKEAVSGPVKLYGRSITQRLLNRVVDDAGDESDQLPVMQHALMRTWDEWEKEHEEGEKLDVRHYEKAGTLLGALSKDADEALEGMEAGGRLVAERMFQALVETDAQGRRTRRPVHVSEIAAVADTTPEKAFGVVNHFRSDGRCFLTTSGESVGDDTTADTSEGDPLVDISHESLIRRWGTLRAWVGAEGRSKEQYTLVAAAALRHESGGAGLLTDPELPAALKWWAERRPNEAWARRYNPAFNLADDFLKESEERSRKDKDEEARRLLERSENEKIRHQNARLRLFTVALILLSVLAFVGFGAAGVSRVRARNSEVEAKENEARALKLADELRESFGAVSAANGEAGAKRDEAVRAQHEAEAAKTLADGQKKLAEEKAKEADKARDDLKAANEGRLKAVEQERKKTLGAVGLLYLDAAQAERERDDEKARETYEKILGLYEEENVPEGKVSALVLLGNSYRDKDRGRARQYYSQAEKLSDTGNKGGSTAQILIDINQGDTFASSTDNEGRRKAVSLYAAARDILEGQIKDSYKGTDTRQTEPLLRLKRSLLIKTGTLYARLGERAKADESYSDAIDTDLLTQPKALVDIGMSYDQPAEASERETYLRRALEKGKAGGRAGEAEVRYYIGSKLTKVVTQVEEGLKYLNEAESLLRSEIDTNPAYGSNKLFAYNVNKRLAHTRQAAGDAYASRGMKPEACAAYGDASGFFKKFDLTSVSSVEEASRSIGCQRQQ